MNELRQWVISISAIVLGIILSLTFEIFGPAQLAASVLIVSMILVMNSLIVAREVSSRLVSSLTERINLADVANHRIEAITNEQIARIELDIHAEHIILMSPSLANDTNGAKYVGMLRHNIERGIRYTYIVPNTQVVRAKVSDLKQIFGQRPDLLEVKLLDEDKFYSLTFTHVVAYIMKSGDPKCYMELPVRDDVTGWWIEMGAQYSALLLNMLPAEWLE